MGVWEPIDLQHDTAKWLLSHGVVAEDELTPGKAGLLVLNDGAAARLRNAKARRPASRAAMMRLLTRGLRRWWRRCSRACTRGRTQRALCRRWETATT